ncbi:contractile injection system protein, VgrG/Pvc8 family [Xanthomonas oryzae pv. oryzicola]|uniref:type VI secretion system Vgr family protein n=2 Tax=Xanthomonas oryzae TaxID=347 RepID=UPI0005CF0D5E|nr:type VI secretion system Vgr family protein [Xanthomonas oryzae]AJQ89220.1 hypothetical protein BE73_20880 [Xanthomonas oryzae pv. oryzicola]AKO03336.1 hypothetical protein ACU16_03285 [Xanthomonas oryzae pv. oryzicola]OWB25543.1 hypothetical protein XocBAI15_13225 [Xanthomonas oryzae pv. oryzicola]
MDISTALAAPSQHARLIQLSSPQPDFVVERFTGTEAVCAGFRFEIDCLSTRNDVDLDGLLEQPLTLQLRQAAGTMRRWHGLCTAVAALGGDGGLVRYRLTMEPWTALPALGRNAVIFQDLDTRAICEQLFAAYPQALFRFDVQQTLPARAITTQYRESDWDFATRIDILAQQKIVLQAGRTSITLEGGNITFACPGTFMVKAGQHPFMGGESNAADLPPLPEERVPTQTLHLDHRYHDDQALAGADSAITLANGQQMRGRLDAQGRATVPTIPAGTVDLMFSPMAGIFGRNDMTPTPNDAVDPSATQLDGVIGKYAIPPAGDTDKGVS